MKKKLLFVLPALFGMFLASCGEKTPEKPSNSGDNSQTPAGDQGGQQSGGESQPGGDTNPQVTQYTITFNDENENLLESKKWDEGTTPSYTYNKADTAEWDYTVHGWALTLGGEVITIPAATADATYYAVVSSVKRSYTISFYNENGGEIKSEVLEFGAQPSCDYSGPTDNAEWDYTFQGWSTSQNGNVLTSIPTVSGEASYYAIVQSSKQYYEITFCENNGYVLQSISLPYGATPSYNYEFGSSMEWAYTFLGWATTPDGTPLNSLPTVTGNATYYAQINKVKKQYTITFVSRGDTSVASITEDYGTQVAKPANPEKDGYKFVAWSTDPDGHNVVEWPYTLVDNVTLYGNWNEKVDIKAYFQALMAEVGHDPFSYIPEDMRPENSSNHVNPGQMNYDFTNFTNTYEITYGGFGEQWNMVIENIEESEKFYSVLTLGEAAINSSVVLFNNYLDGNPDDTADHTLNETTYTAKIDFHNGLLKYTIQYKTNLNIPFFGNVMPQVDMTYDVTSLEKAVRVQLTENNAMRYVVTENSYTFGVEYGVETVSRKAYCQINRQDDDSVEGHIYEFVQYKNKDLVPSCADFYIGEDYTSVVGNKASGLPGFTGYINELYETEEGKLLGYKVRETFTKWGFEKTYNTLWFNLNDIQNILSIKAIDNGSVDPHENNHDIYLNGSSSIFEPTYNKKLLVNTSRKYDIEMRKQYFYGFVDTTLTKYETEIPMMFIQDDGTESGENNYSTFEDDISSKSGISAHVLLADAHLQKIRADYLSLIDIFAAHKEDVDSVAIATYIGSALVI